MEKDTERAAQGIVPAVWDAAEREGQGTMAEKMILVLLILVSAEAVRQIIKRKKYGGSCCGEHEETVKKIQAADRRKSHYPYSAVLKVEGMTCENCARRVENALNTLDGTWAKVDISTHLAKLRLKEPPDEKKLVRIVAEAGYSARML